MERVEVLIVDDDRLFCRAIERVLKARFEGVSIGFCHDIASALRRLEPDVSAVEIVVLDMCLPAAEGATPRPRGGLELLRWLRREREEVGVLISTGSQELEVAVEAVNCGAHGYLLKPYALSQFEEVLEEMLRHRVLSRAHLEVLSRLELLRASLGRWERVLGGSLLGVAPLQRLQSGGLLLDLHTWEVTRDGHRIELAPRELQVLRLLMERRGEAVTFEEWSATLGLKRKVIHNVIHRLRKKIEPEPATPCYIQSVSGGYALVSLPAPGEDKADGA